MARRILWLPSHLQAGWQQHTVPLLELLVNALSTEPIGQRLSRMKGRQHSRDKGDDMDTENQHQELKSASATLVDGMHFAGVIGDVRIDLDAEASVGGAGVGPQPHRLLLLAMAGCTAMDVISILRKKRQQVTRLRVEVQGSTAEQHPRVYTRFEVLYRVRGTTIDPLAVERAIELSTTRYCPVINLLGKWRR